MRRALIVGASALAVLVLYIVYNERRAVPVALGRVGDRRGAVVAARPVPCGVRGCGGSFELPVTAHFYHSPDVS